MHSILKIFKREEINMRAIGLNTRIYWGGMFKFILGEFQLFILLFPFTTLFTALPSLAGAEPLVNGISVLLIGLSFLYLLLEGRLVNSMANSFPLILFLSILAISIIWVHPAMKDNSLHYITRTLITVIQAFVIVQVLKEEDKLFDVMKFMAILISVASLLFILIFPSQSNWIIEGVERSQSFFSTPNNLGQFLAFSFLMVNFHKRKDLSLPIVLLLDGIILYQLYKCDSMTSLAAIAVIILAFQFKPMLKAVFILIVLAGMLVPNLYRVLPGSSNTSIGIANRDLTFTGRTEVWNTMVKDAEHKHRTLQGFGAGGYWITDAYNPISTINELDWDPGQGHNGYMDIFIMTGIVGVLVFLFFLGGFINNIFRKVSFVEKIPYLLVLIILINNITESSFFREKHLYFVLFILMYWHVYLKDNDLLTSPEDEWHLEE